MGLSTQFTVSVQMLMLIMSIDDKKVTSDMISESTGGNPVMIRQLFGKMKDAGILNVSTGRGVTALAKDPSDISLWDIYMAVEGDATSELFKFHPKISNECPIGRFFRVVLSGHLDEAVQAMSDELSKVTLAQLVSEWQAVNSANE